MGVIVVIKDLVILEEKFIMIYDNDGPVYSSLTGKPDCFTTATCPSSSPCAAIWEKLFGSRQVCLNSTYEENAVFNTSPEYNLQGSGAAWCDSCVCLGAFTYCT